MRIRCRLSSRMPDPATPMTTIISVRFLRTGRQTYPLRGTSILTNGDSENRPFGTGDGMLGGCNGYL